MKNELKKWNCENEECIERIVKHSINFDFLDEDDLIDITVVNGILSVSEDYKMLENYLQDWLEKGLIPNNCECSIMYMGGAFNLIGFFDDSTDDDEPDINYFIGTED